MILSDQDIIEYVKDGIIGIEPFNVDNVQSASYDVTLDDEFAVDEGEACVLDLSQPVNFQRYRLIEPGASMPLKPMSFMLGSTIEKITLPPYIIARVEGRSSYGRLGLMIHSTAGFIDPGFSGNITLELFNLSNTKTIPLTQGMRIGQIAFELMVKPAKVPYGADRKNKNKYHKQCGVQESKVNEDFIPQ